MAKTEYGRGKGYAEIAARRVWRLAGLSSQKELFALSDAQILAIPDVGQKTLEAIRKLEQQSGDHNAQDQTHQK
jgi:hypothetical protein